LKKTSVSFKVGRAELKDTAQGNALKENGLVKILVGEDDRILGAHIIGPEASTLIHEIIIAMKTIGKVSAIVGSVYVHPALSGVVQNAFFPIGWV
jgi:dihydrolipoamide dehydrogenase